jgi:putative membrane protein
MKDLNKNPLPYFTTIFIILIGSLILSHDRFTWILEVFPVLIGLPILVFTYRRFPLTDILYSLIVLHTLILAVGGIYTYAKVPFGFWLQDWFGFARNHYDRIGHFAQGFIPALLTREILLRTSPLRKGKWLNFIVVSICLAVSAFYELIEFAYALGTGETAESFLGSQGDIWDAQWDMTFALMGATLSLVILSKFHDARLKKIGADVTNN